MPGRFAEAAEDSRTTLSRRTKIFSEMTLRKDQQMEDFLVGLRRMVDLIRAGPCEEQRVIRVRNTMYTLSRR